MLQHSSGGGGREGEGGGGILTKTKQISIYINNKTAI